MTGIMHQMLGQANVAGSSGLFIAADTPNVNIRAILLANGWNGTSAVTANLVIAASATVWSTSIATPALDTGAAFPVGSSITITNNGKILGRGGKGGSYYLIFSPIGLSLVSPENGGPALKAQSAITVINNGIISGGGGGGGAGGYGSAGSDAYGGKVFYDAGPGGGGLGNGTKGYQGSYVYKDSGGGAITVGYPAGVATAGTLTSPGTGGIGASGRAGGGGGGGSYAGTGGSGGDGYDRDYGTIIGQTGGTGGVATIGNANITWSVTGTIYGALT